jgi:hypothetical protein
MSREKRRIVPRQLREQGGHTRGDSSARLLTEDRGPGSEPRVDLSRRGDRIQRLGEGVAEE